MKISDIDTAVTLRNHRRQAMRMRSATFGFLKISFTYGGLEYDPATVISVDCVRMAVADACTAFIAEKERELAALGITPDDDTEIAS